MLFGMRPEETFKEKTAILVAAAIICAVRTARDEVKMSPRILSAASESITLARLLWEKICRG